MEGETPAEINPADSANAELAYTTYATSTGWIDFQSFEQLPEGSKAAWAAAAQAVLDRAKEK